MKPITAVTMMPRGPGGEAQVFELDWLREHAEELIPEAETRAEQALAAIVVSLVDTIKALNDLLEDL